MYGNQRIHPHYSRPLHVTIDTHELQETLEHLIDSNDLECVLNAIVETCYLKAEHLRVNWQDNESAAIWEDYAAILNKALEDDHE